MPKPRSHPVIEHLIEDSGLTRAEIAKRAGITPKTLYYWEHQLTRVKTWMITMVSQHSGVSLESVPAYVHKKASEDAERHYATRTEVKAGFKAKTKEPPPNDHKRDVYGESAKAKKEREARQEAKATDPKRHRIRNFGHPTAANQNPYTFSRIHDGHRPKLSKGIDLPSDAEYPDMIAAALKGLTYYEAAYVGYHTIPDATGPSVGNTPHVCGICAGFYWNRPNGSYSQAETIDKANTMMAKQIAEDEAATADLI